MHLSDSVHIGSEVDVFCLLRTLRSVGGLVAQWFGRRIHNREVVGSTPDWFAVK